MSDVKKEQDIIETPVVTEDVNIEEAISVLERVNERIVLHPVISEILFVGVNDIEQIFIKPIEEPDCCIMSEESEEMINQILSILHCIPCCDAIFLLEQVKARINTQPVISEAIFID